MHASSAIQHTKEYHQVPLTAPPVTQKESSAGLTGAEKTKPSWQATVPSPRASAPRGFQLRADLGRQAEVAAVISKYKPLASVLNTFEFRPTSANAYLQQIPTE